MAFLVVFSRCLIGMVFVAAAFGKLRSRKTRQTFVDSLRQMGIVRPRHVVATSALVAGGEVTVSLLMLPVGGPATACLGFSLAAVLLIGFAAAIHAVLRNGTAVTCPCFGSASIVPFGYHHVVRNGGLAMVAGLGGYASLGSIVFDVGSALVAAAAASVCALLVTRVDDLVLLFAPTPRLR
jgi:hypothetical protein